MKYLLSRLILVLMMSVSWGCHLEDKGFDQGETTKMTSDQVIQLLDDLFMERVKESPQYMTYLGMRERYDQWDDNSDRAADKRLQMTRDHLARVKAIDLTNANDAVKLSVKMFIEQANMSIEADRWRYHNYPVSQMRGVHGRIPSFLINQHLIANELEAKAYITRLAGVPKVLDQLKVNLEIRENKNIIAPKFVFPLVIDSIDKMLAGAPFEQGPDSTLLADFKRKIDALDITDDTKSKLIINASDTLKSRFYPAYRSLQIKLRELESIANDDHGVWKFPDGDKFYEFALRRTTTTGLSPDEIHELGLTEVARIQTEMRGIMQAVGFDSDLQAFFAFMRDDPQFYYSDSENGKQAYLDDATAIIDNMKSLLDGLFITKPKADLIVKAVEPFREASAGQAFYQRPAPDGSRPGTYFANLYKMKDMSKYNMEALAYHEGIPGHHMQISIAQELEDIPKFRLFGGYTVFSEGWALYSETLPKEIGLYSDPYSDFGRLSEELKRACRLVVDTGIHSKKWTREKAIAYMNSNLAYSESYNIRQIERYIVMPSQATAYKIGMLKIQQLRARAQNILGEKFDIREFHDVVLKDGAVSMPILENNINAWVKSLDL
ncbi:MAG: DUF885 domain-containing protein [Porticoccaceae bacterium]|nr:DUF885 domain-containing protein [Porticoccaceae bacterium]